MKIYTKTGKFTKAFRHKIYKKALDYYYYIHIGNRVAIGICYCMQEALFSDYIYFKYSKIYEHFPELIKRKPKKTIVGHYWWPLLERRKRISVLKACIRLYS